MEGGQEKTEGKQREGEVLLKGERQRERREDQK